MLTLYRSRGEEFTLGDPTLFTVKVMDFNPARNSALLKVTPNGCSSRLVRIVLNQPQTICRDLAIIKLQSIRANSCAFRVTAPGVAIQRPDYKGAYQCRSVH